MKQLFHQGLALLFVVCLASCSKSDLELNKKDATTNNMAFTPPPNENANQNNSNSQQVTHIYRFINQPYELELGNEKSSVIQSDGSEDVVFYVVLDPGYTPDPSADNELGFVDMYRDEYFMHCDLISSEYAADYGIQVPKELSEQTFMFAKLQLRSFEQYAGVPIGLHSNIYLSTGGSSTGAKLASAFVYQQ